MAIVGEAGVQGPREAQWWAAQQVARQHSEGRCKQCGDSGCSMLGWARAVLGGGVVAYPGGNEPAAS